MIDHLHRLRDAAKTEPEPANYAAGLRALTGAGSYEVRLDCAKVGQTGTFVAYAGDHEAASIRRCWSTWNVLCTFLYTGEQLAANPMQLVGRPKLAKPLPKAFPRTTVEALLDSVALNQGSQRHTDWPERDLAIILTALLAGLRADELQQVDVGHIRTTDHGAAVIRVKAKVARSAACPSKPNCYL